MQQDDAQTKQNGADHVYTLVTAGNLANLLKRMGQMEEAETLSRATLKANSVTF